MNVLKYEVSTLLYMQQRIDSTIQNAITEKVMNNKIVNYDDLKESVNYILEEQIRFIENTKKGEN